MTDSLSYCIAKDMIPIYAVEKKGFKTLLKSFNSKYEVPSQKYFSQTALPALYAKTRETVSNELEEVKEEDTLQLPQICGPVLPVSHILVTLFISSTTTGSYAVVACKQCLCHSNILVRTLLRLFK